MTANWSNRLTSVIFVALLTRELAITFSLSDPTLVASLRDALEHLRRVLRAIHLHSAMTVEGTESLEGVPSLDARGRQT